MGVGLWLFSVDNKKINEHLAPKHSFIQQPVLKEKILTYLSREAIDIGYTETLH
jgi:hypothetical protein